MLLPKKLIRRYTYNENEICYETYPVNQLDELIAGLLIKNANFKSVNINTALVSKNSYKIKHTLETDGVKRNISEEEYEKYLKICFFKLRYHIIKVNPRINRDGSLSYKFELCPLVRKQTELSKILKKG